MPIADIRGVRINYEVLGSTGPWAALSPGGRRGYQELVPLAGRIAAEGFRVLLHDRRNTGASDILIEGEHGEEEIWADDLHALLGKLGGLPAFVGGTSSGSRMSMLTYLRHREAVRGLMLIRVTGGEFAAGRLPENYYKVFIRAANEGGMAAVCATEQYRERIAANPANRERLMAMDPKRYIAAMQHWHDIFVSGPHSPVMGVTEDQLRSIKVPVIVIPGNDKVHAMKSGLAAQQLIPGAQLFKLPIEDQDVPLIPFNEWKPHEEAIAAALTGFMKRAAGIKAAA